MRRAACAASAKCAAAGALRAFAARRSEDGAFTTPWYDAARLCDAAAAMSHAAAALCSRRYVKAQHEDSGSKRKASPVVGNGKFSRACACACVAGSSTTYRIYRHGSQVGVNAQRKIICTPTEFTSSRPECGAPAPECCRFMSTAVCTRSSLFAARQHAGAIRQVGATVFGMSAAVVSQRTMKLIEVWPGE